LPRRLGQHFLVRGATLERIARAACPDPEPLVIEIGAGKGALTARLLERAGRVVAIELDRTLVDHLHARFAGESRLEVLHADILEINLAQWGPAVLAGNLPYYITSPILERFAAARGVLRRGVFLVQKEVADRITAAPGQREYGYFTVHIRLLAAPERILDVNPAAFHPPPKVHSTVIRLTPHDRAAELGIPDIPAFLRFVSLCFHHKRKTLRNNLAEAFPKEAIASLPEGGLRAEQISIEQLADLYRRLVPLIAEA
jgi:16S rRNA (adenine1518-N6/adenine1519-N6)-dimethyltransferase